MSNRKQGFTLIDTLIATLIVLTGSAAVIEVSSEATRSWTAHRERLMAREILGRLEYLPFEDLAHWKETGYDALGRPGEDAGRTRYRLKVEPYEAYNWTTYTCTLTYENADGLPVTLSLMRKEYHGEEETASL